MMDFSVVIAKLVLPLGRLVLVMSVGLLLITHNDIGAALLATVVRMLGTCPLPAHA